MWASSIQQSLSILLDMEVFLPFSNFSTISFCFVSADSSQSLLELWITLTADGSHAPNTDCFLIFNSTCQLQNDLPELTGVLEPIILKGLNVTLAEWIECIGSSFYVLSCLYLADLGQISSPFIDTNTSLNDSTYNIFVNE